MHRPLLLALATAASASAFDAARRAPEGVAERDFSPFHRTRTVTDAAGVRRSQLVALGGELAHDIIGDELRAAAMSKKLSVDDYQAGWPTYLGTLKAGAGPQHFAGACFKNTTMEVTLEADGTPVVNFDFAGAASKTCSDVFLLLTSSHWAVQYEYFTGTDRTVWFPFADDEERADFMRDGVAVMLWKGSWHDELSFVYEAYKIFKQQKPEAIVRFLEETSDIKFAKRVPNTKLVPREGDIAPGDVIGAWHPTAVQTGITWLTGRAVGHGAIILEFDGELWVCETNTPDLLNGPIGGIQRHPLRQWLDVRHKAGFTVWYMRLEDERRAAFNNSAAVAWFEEHRGEDYGSPTLITTGLDSVANSFPAPIAPAAVFPILSIAHRVAKDYIHTVLFLPFQARMRHYYGKDVDCDTVECLVAAAEAVGTTANEVMALVESQDLKYPIFDHKTNTTAPRTAYVCDAYVIKTLQVSGVLEGYAIEPSEFTPRDLGELGIYKKKADYCDNEGDYHCVLAGDWTSDLQGFNTRAPYDHMNERCAMLPHSYTKVPEYC